MPKPVLIIDDNPVNQRMVIRYLNAKGYPTLGAGTTEEADAALAQGPGMALVDVSLPGEDGLSWVRRVRASGASKSTVMIAFTAHALPGDRERALAAGCEDVMTKPVDWKALLAAAARFCGVPDA